MIRCSGNGSTPTRRSWGHRSCSGDSPRRENWKVAADVLTEHLRPGLLRLYVPEDRASDVRRKLRLAPSESGSVELCKLYSREIVDEPAIPGMPTTDPVFVYAELMAHGDDRMAETALRVRQEHLAWTL